MRRLLAAVLAALLPAAALAEDASAPQPTTTGLTASVSLGGGGELGLDSGKAGVLEIEAAVGWEFESVGLRPELAATIGIEPDGHAALRPGVRWTLPGLPVQLRAALDASNSRRSGLHWRWLLVGAAAEIRMTSVLGLFGEIDTGAPLSSSAGLPLLLRGGASFRF
jgi:opacity protein-like surface antigen